jgi:hypothetical protein
MRVIDMQKATVRDAVLTGEQPAVDLYRSNLAVDYDAMYG